MEERILRYFIGRINKENGEQNIMQFDRYSGVLRATQGMSEANGYETATTPNRVSAWLNSIDKELDGKHYYYRLDSDNRTNRVIPEDAPEEVLRWFNGEEDTGEEDIGEDEEEAEPTE